MAHSIERFGEVIPGIDACQKVGVHLGAMGHPREDPLRIQLIAFARNEGGGAKAQFKLRQGKHQHIERIRPLKARLEPEHGSFLGSGGSIATQHVAAVVVHHRRRRAA